MRMKPSKPTRNAWAALLALSLAPFGPAAAQAPSPPSVTVARPTVKTVAEFDEYTGRLEAVERVELRARVSGLMVARHFQDGQTVQRGDLLFSLDPDLFQVALEAARAEMQRQEAQVEFTREDFERVQNLSTRGSATQRDLDQRRSAMLQAQAALAAARAQARQAELNLSYTRIVAPIAGRVGAASVQPGNFVQGGIGGGTVLTSIVALDPIRFTFEASEANYLRYVRLAERGERPSGRGTRHPVFLRLSDETSFAREGELEFVDNEVRPGTGTIRARALFPNPGGVLTPGLFGRVRLPATIAQPVTLVPDAAIVADQTRRLIYVVGEGDRVVARPVTLGPLHEGLRIVRGEISPQDRIIVSGVQRARPGQPVTPREEPAAPAAPPAAPPVATTR